MEQDKKSPLQGGIKKWFRKENLIVLVLGGILLFVIALPVEHEEDGAEKKSSVPRNSLLTMDALGGEVSESEATDETLAHTVGNTDQEYAVYLEEKLRDALRKVADVGEVEVMITLQSSRELVVEKEQPIVRSTTSESDSQGGSREVVEMDSQENTVYRSDGSASEPYVIKTLVPEIEGVLVVAEGAGQGTVSHSIVEIVQALFGVDAHKVKVVKMK